MVQLVRWPRTNTVAYPAADGRLVLCELEAMQLHTLEAHNESFYAVFVVGQDLCTVGTSDGILKAWQRIAPAPAWQCNAPTGIIGGQEAGPDTGQILLITYDGQTAIHVLRSGKLHLHRALAENHARVVCSANWQARLKILQKRRTAKVQELCTQIKECVAAGQSGEIDTLHRQLIAMGSQTLSLALQAWRAAKEKDTVGELRARYSLAQRLPTDAPLAATSLSRYGHVLHESWLLRDALTVYAHIGGPEKDHVLPGWLEQTAEMMEGDDWVAHAKPPIPDLVGAATILNRPFTGRWVLNVLGTIQFPEGLLTAEGLVRKYEQVRNEEGRSGLPVAEARLFHWLSRRMPRTIATVLFIGAADPATEGAELAVQVLQDGLQTILVEHLLFHAVGTLKQGQSAMDYNNRTTEVLARIGRPERAGPWLRAVRRALSRAIQRLHTEAVYRRREGRD
ncbi:MAG: hypothetical protein NTV86_00910 [Planctomycetota bacterium]|nr:hypothetical protein [Planctomycetota bacterium]